MFNFYQNFNQKREEDVNKEPEVTGHDRFCQERPGARRKRRVATNRRTQSAIELDCNDSFASVRSVLLQKGQSASVEDNDPEEEKGYYQLTSKIDSLAKILFSRVYAIKGFKDQPEADRNNGRGGYTALDQQQLRLSNNEESSTRDGAAECMELEKRSRDRALSICLIYTQETPRYVLLKQLNNVGSRLDKHWFAVKDMSLRTDRLLTLALLNRNCSLTISPSTRDVLNKLFLTLRHPYICPVLDLEFIEYETEQYVILLQPINQGSLKDMIYGIDRNGWNEDWTQKYAHRGKGLPISEIQRMGREILEALVFLKNREFPTVTHLHSGNIIIQNGVARLAALENTLLGFTSRTHPIIAPRLPPKSRTNTNFDTICFGHMLFEMCAGYELCSFAPSDMHMSDIQMYPQVCECLDFLFDRKAGGVKFPSIEELLLQDLFRNIDLREMRSASHVIFRSESMIPITSLLDGIRRQKTPITRSANIDSEDMISLSSPETERTDSDSVSQMYKEMTITPV